MKQLVLVLVASAVGITALAAGLRSDAFYTGDSGVKLIAARNALDHPSRPFEISLPTIAAEPAPHVEPFFSVHGEHAHAVTSPIFPALTAPFLKQFGIRGVYVLPAVGLLATLCACAWAATCLDDRRHPALVFIVAAVATPFLFYGLEYWEHTVALALATGAWALFLRGRALAAGLLVGASTLLRPEAAWFGLAALLSTPLLSEPPRAGAWGMAVVGVVVAIAPFEAYTWIHFGTWWPPYLSVNAGGLTEAWFAGRAEIAWLWFVTGSDASFWRVAPVVACAIASEGVGSRRRGRGYLWAVALIDVILVILTAPNDGGGQWGPRYLLFAYLPLVVIAADAIDARPRRSATAMAVLLVVSGACAWTGRSAYRQLRGAKNTYGAVVDLVSREVPFHGYAVTDLWWLDQVAASATAGRQMLFASDGATGTAIVRRLSDAAVASITVIRSASESPDTGAWLEGSCYFEEQRDTISTRDLVAIRLRHRCRPQARAAAPILRGGQEGRTSSSTSSSRTQRIAGRDAAIIRVSR